jgi:hypothetical protein
VPSGWRRFTTFSCAFDPGGICGLERLASIARVSGDPYRLAIHSKKLRWRAASSSVRYSPRRRARTTYKLMSLPNSKPFCAHGSKDVSHPLNLLFGKDSPRRLRLLL